MKDQQITSTDLRKYRTELPNMYDDAGLDVYAFRLLAHYVRVGNCYESIRTTAKKCNMSHPTVIRARDTLAAKGFIQIQDQEKFDTLRIEVVNMWSENFTRYDKNEVDQVVETLNGVVERLNGGGSLVERGGREIESKKEPVKKNHNKKEPIKNKPSWNIPNNLYQPDFVQAWEDFQQHRKEIKKKLTPLAGSRTLNKLSKYPVDVAIQMLEQSIENGWTGVFEIKNGTRSAQDPVLVALEKRRQRANG